MRPSIVAAAAAARCSRRPPPRRPTSPSTRAAPPAPSRGSRLRVPNERDSASTSRSSSVAAGHRRRRLRAGPGLAATVADEEASHPDQDPRRRDHRAVGTITWTGDAGRGRSPPGQFRDFPISVRIPDKPGDADVQGAADVLGRRGRALDRRARRRRARAAGQARRRGRRPGPRGRAAAAPAADARAERRRRRRRSTASDRADRRRARSRRRGRRPLRMNRFARRHDLTETSLRRQNWRPRPSPPLCRCSGDGPRDAAAEEARTAGAFTVVSVRVPDERDGASTTKVRVGCPTASTRSRTPRRRAGR